MGYQEEQPDIVGVRDGLHQLYRQPTAVEGGDIDDAEFFLDVMSDINRYITGIDETPSRRTAVSGRTCQYSIEDITDVIEEERADPRYEDGVPHLLSALHALNQYQGKDGSPVSEPADGVGEPVDSNYLVSCED